MHGAQPLLSFFLEAFVTVFSQIIFNSTISLKSEEVGGLINNGLSWYVWQPVDLSLPAVYETASTFSRSFSDGLNTGRVRVRGLVLAIMIML
jgi:hypothetical protein